VGDSRIRGLLDRWLAVDGPPARWWRPDDCAGAERGILVPDRELGRRCSRARGLAGTKARQDERPRPVDPHDAQGEHGERRTLPGVEDGLLARGDLPSANLVDVRAGRGCVGKRCARDHVRVATRSGETAADERSRRGPDDDSVERHGCRRVVRDPDECVQGAHEQREAGSGEQRVGPGGARANEWPPHGGDHDRGQQQQGHRGRGDERHDRHHGPHDRVRARRPVQRPERGQQPEHKGRRDDGRRHDDPPRRGELGHERSNRQPDRTRQGEQVEPDDDLQQRSPVDVLGHARLVRETALAIIGIAPLSVGAALVLGGGLPALRGQVLEPRGVGDACDSPPPPRELLVVDLLGAGVARSPADRRPWVGRVVVQCAPRVPHALPRHDLIPVAAVELPAPPRNPVRDRAGEEHRGERHGDEDHRDEETVPDGHDEQSVAEWEPRRPQAKPGREHRRRADERRPGDQDGDTLQQRSPGCRHAGLIRRACARTC
jgi:hypothetical protein